MTKTYPRTKKGAVKVTFSLPNEVGAKKVYLLGEFNNWDPKATPMRRKSDGSFSVDLKLEPGREYRFKYWLDGDRWENDQHADRYEPNAFGSLDSIITL